MQRAYYGILAVGAIVGLLWGALAPVPSDRRLLFRTAALPALPAISLWLSLVSPDGLRFPVYDVDIRDWTGFFPIACVTWVGSLVGVTLGVLCRRGFGALREVLLGPEPLGPEANGPSAHAPPPRTQRQASRFEAQPTVLLIALSVGLLVVCVASSTLGVIREVVFAEEASYEGRGPFLALYLLPTSGILLAGLALALLKIQRVKATRLYRLAAPVTAILLVIAVRWSHTRAIPSNVAWYSEILGSLYLLAWIGGLFGLCSLLILFRSARQGDGATWTLAIVLLGQSWTLAANGFIAFGISDILSPRAKDRSLIASFQSWVEGLLADQMLVLILGFSLWMGALAGARRASHTPAHRSAFPDGSSERVPPAP